MEALKNITQEQYDQLLLYSDAPSIENFFVTLNGNFGDGEVLPFEYVLHFFMSSQLNLGLYIDTYRMLALAGRSQAELTQLSTADEITKLHDELAVGYSTQISEELDRAYAEAVAPFSHMSGKVGDCRFELIANIEELNAEGRDMSHCIATYVYIIAQRKYIGLRVFNERTKERLTLGLIRYANNALQFNQLKAWGNHPASIDSRRIVMTFCKKYDIPCNPADYDIMLPENVVQ